MICLTNLQTHFLCCLLYPLFLTSAHCLFGASCLSFRYVLLNRLLLYKCSCPHFTPLVLVIFLHFRCVFLPHLCEFISSTDTNLQAHLWTTSPKNEDHKSVVGYFLCSFRSGLWYCSLLPFFVVLFTTLLLLFSVSGRIRKRSFDIDFAPFCFLFRQISHRSPDFVKMHLNIFDYGADCVFKI